MTFTLIITSFAMTAFFHERRIYFVWWVDEEKNLFFSLKELA